MFKYNLTQNRYFQYILIGAQIYSHTLLKLKKQEFLFASGIVQYLEPLKLVSAIARFMSDIFRETSLANQIPGACSYIIIYGGKICIIHVSYGFTADCKSKSIQCLFSFEIFFKSKFFKHIYTERFILSDSKLQCFHTKLLAFFFF